jgi:hypothetical protein
MGSYDVNFYGSTNINLDGLTNGVDHADTYYWGIMCSNGCKNFNLKNCVMNRFDAHEGFWNATIVDTTLGYTFNVIGGGELYVEGCERTTGASFISMRGDYGSTFNGKVTIKDSVFGGKQSYKTKNDPRYGKYYDDYEPLYVFSSGYIVNYKGEYNASEASSFPYLKWDFGYTCYLPQDVVIENLTTGNNSTALYLYNDIGNAAFEKPADFVQPGDDVDRLYYNQYQLTKKITYRNQKTPIQICRDASSILYQRLALVVDVENTEE